MDSTAVTNTLLEVNKEMYGQAYDIIKIWMGIVVLIFLALLGRYSFGFGFTKEKPNPYEKETFGMPRGVFRGILTLSLLFIVLLLEVISLNGKVMTIDKNLFVPEIMYKELMVAFQMMLAFYFGSKMVHHVTSADRDKSKTIAETAKPSVQGAGGFDEAGASG
jgi:hypothetical protein